MNKRTDIDILQAVAEHGVLTIQQATELFFVSAQMARRHLRRLVSEDLLSRGSGTLSGRKGRPETLVFLGEAGRRTIKSELGFTCEVPTDRMVEHLLLINWFRLHLRRLEALYNLSCRFIAANSPSNADFGGTSVLRNSVSEPRTSEQQHFIPDGAFTMTEKTSRRALLFFLEADMGTEALANGKGNDIGRKILNYRTLLGSKGYKRYETVFQSTLNGFRVLFLCHTPPRRQQLCRLVQGMAPADFVWVADQAAMVAKGLQGRIWSAGGHEGEPDRSILGGMVRPGGPGHEN